MPVNEGVAGIGVTPLQGGAAVGPTNPLPVQVVTGALGVVKFFYATPTANGDNTVVAAVAGKKIRVLSWNLDNNGNTPNSFFFTGTGATPISSTGTGVLGGSDQAPSGLFETVAGELLGINMSAATAGATLSGSYQEV